MSYDDPAPVGESKEDKAVRLKKNRSKHARHIRVEYRKESIRHCQAAYKDYQDEVQRRWLEDKADRDRIT